MSFLRYWWKNYRYQRQQMGASRIAAAWDALLDCGTVWWMRKWNGM